MMSKEHNLPQAQTEVIENDALTSYLDYYKSLERPGFALLVTGAWGSGKTFQVTAALDESESCYTNGTLN